MLPLSCVHCPVLLCIARGCRYAVPTWQDEQDIRSGKKASAPGGSRGQGHGGHAATAGLEAPDQQQWQWQPHQCTSSQRATAAHTLTTKPPLPAQQAPARQLLLAAEMLMPASSALTTRRRITLTAGWRHWRRLAASNGPMPPLLRLPLVLVPARGRRRPCCGCGGLAAPASRPEAGGSMQRLDS